MAAHTHKTFCGHVVVKDTCEQYGVLINRAGPECDVVVVNQIVLLRQTASQVVDTRQERCSWMTASSWSKNELRAERACITKTQTHPQHFLPTQRLYGIHGGPRSESLILVAELRYLEEGIDSIAFQAVNLETASPIFWNSVSRVTPPLPRNTHRHIDATWEVQYLGADPVHD